MTTLVLFKDTFEECPAPQYGVLLDDGVIACLCCGGTFDPGEYEVIKSFPHDQWHYVDETLKEFFYNPKERE